MKKMMMSLMLALMLTLVPSCLFAADFVEIYRGNNYLIYLDTSSIQDQGTYYKAWTKWLYFGEAQKKINERYNKEVSHTLELAAYLKNIKQNSFLVMHTYDKDGKILKSLNFENYPKRWESVVPGSVGEAIIDAVYFFAEK